MCIRDRYIGVPPGQNARALLAVKGLNGERQLFTEGWPEKHRTGRKIGNQHVRLLLTPDALRIWENGKLLFETTQRVLASQEAYLYLQMSSHSNYPPREVYFDNIVVR